jgi:hypothetical protein
MGCCYFDSFSAVYENDVELRCEGCNVLTEIYVEVHYETCRHADEGGGYIDWTCGLCGNFHTKFHVQFALNRDNF